MAFAAVVVFGFWYRPGEVVDFWDQTMPLRPGLDVAALTHLWHAEYGFGRVDATGVSLIPYEAVLWLLQGVTRSLSFSQMFLYWALVSSSLVGAYRVLSAGIACLAGRRRAPAGAGAAAAALGALFYTFNPYAVFFEWRIVSSTIFLQATLPWMVGLWMAWPRSANVRRMVRLLAGAAGLTICAAPGLSDPAFVPVTLLLLVGAGWIIDGLRNLWRYWPVLATMCLGSAFWLIPVVASVSAIAGVGSYGGTTSALVENSANLRLLNVVRLLGEAPIYEQYRGEADFPWVHVYAGSGVFLLFTLMCFVPIFIILVAAARSKEFRSLRATRVLAGLLAVGIYGGMGAHGRTSWLFRFLFEHVSFLRAYRDPFAKFGFLIVCCISGLMAIAAFELLWNGSRRSEWRLRGFGASGLATLAVLGMGWPLLSGGVFRGPGSVRRGAYVEIPGSVARVASILRARDSNDGVVLSFPEQTTPLLSETWQYGFVGLDPLLSLSLRPVISSVIGSAPEDPYVQALYELYREMPSEAVTASFRLGVRWLLIRWDNDFAFGGVGSTNDLRQLAASLATVRSVRRVYSSSELTLYELMSPQDQGRQVLSLARFEGSGAHAGLSLVAGEPAQLVDVAPVAAVFVSARPDVGSRELRFTPTSGGDSITMRVPAHMEGSIRARIAPPRGLGLACIDAIGSANARVTVAFSQYEHGRFVRGGLAAPVDPPSLSLAAVGLVGRETLCFDLGSLDFVANRINLQLAAEGSALARVSFFGLRFARGLQTEGAPASGRQVEIELQSSRSVGGLYVPALGDRRGGYLKLRVRTAVGDALVVSIGRLIDGKCVSGAQLTPVAWGSGVVVHGDLSVSSASGGNVWFALPATGKDRWLLFVLEGASRGVRSAFVSNAEWETVAPAPEAIVGALATNVAVGALVDLDLASGAGATSYQVAAGGGSVPVRELLRASRDVVVIVPENFSEGLTLEIRRSGGRWMAAPWRHLRADGFLNGWLITRKSATGASKTGSVLVRLVYRPQAALSLGLLLTGGSIVLLLIGYLLIEADELSRNRLRRHANPPVSRLPGL